MLLALTLLSDPIFLRFSIEFFFFRLIVKLDLLVSIVLGDIPNQVESGDLINFVDNEDLRKKSLTPDRISSWSLFHIQTTSS